MVEAVIGQGVHAAALSAQHVNPTRLCWAFRDGSGAAILGRTGPGE